MELNVYASNWAEANSICGILLAAGYDAQIGKVMSSDKRNKHMTYIIIYEKAGSPDSVGGEGGGANGPHSQGVGGGKGSPYDQGFGGQL